MHSKQIVKQNQCVLDEKLKQAMLPYLPSELDDIVIAYVSIEAKMQEFEKSLLPNESSLFQFRQRLLEKNNQKQFKNETYDWHQVACGLTILEKVTDENLNSFATKCIAEYKTQHSMDDYKHRTSKNTKFLLDCLTAKNNIENKIFIIESYLLDHTNSKSKLYKILIDEISQSFITLPIIKSKMTIPMIEDETALNKLNRMLNEGIGYSDIFLKLIKDMTRAHQTINNSPLNIFKKSLPSISFNTIAELKSCLDHLKIIRDTFIDPPHRISDISKLVSSIDFMNDVSIPAMHNALLTKLEKIHNNAELKEVSSLNYQIRTLISNVEETKMIIHQLFTFYQNKLNTNEPNVTLRI